MSVAKKEIEMILDVDAQPQDRALNVKDEVVIGSGGRTKRDSQPFKSHTFSLCLR